jgi:hypothetical protein
MESLYFISIDNINAIKIGDYLIIGRNFMTQKYLDLMDDAELEEFYNQEGVVTNINFANNYFTIINKKNREITIDFTTKSVNTWIQKRVPIICID